MPRIASPLPLACGTLALLLFMGSAQAALFRFANTPPQPKTVAEAHVLRCGAAVQLFDQGRGSEALLLLRADSDQPMPLPLETTLHVEFTPAGQLLRLSQQMCRAAKAEAAVGQAGRARGYVAQCYRLGQRIRTTPQSNPDLCLRVAYFIERAAQRAEAALQSSPTETGGLARRAAPLYQASL